MTTANQNPKLSNLYSRIARIRKESATIKQSVEELRAGTDLFYAPFGDSQICTYAMAPDGTIIAASPALVRLLGYESLDELRARNSDGGEYDSDYVLALFARHSGQIDDIESVWRCKDGSIIQVRESARAIYDDQGRPIEYDGIIEKIIGPERRANDGRRTTDPGLSRDEGDERRTTNDERRTTNDGRRTTDNGRRTTDETKPVFALPSVVEQPSLDQPRMVDQSSNKLARITQTLLAIGESESRGSDEGELARTPQPPLPLRQERGSRATDEGEETQCDVVSEPVIEAASAATKPMFSLSNEAARTPQPPLPLRQERGSRATDEGEETQCDVVSEPPHTPASAVIPPSLDLPSMADPPLIESASLAEQPPNTLPHVVEPAAHEAFDGAGNEPRTPNPEPRTPNPEQRTTYETKPMFARPSKVDEPVIEAAGAVTPPPNSPAFVLAELLIEPAPVAAKPPRAPAGTGRNKVQHRGSAIQRAVERLKGQVNTESAGEDRRSLLGGSMELREYWKIIQKRLWLIVLLMLIGGSVSGYYAYQQPPMYRSTTTLYLNPAAASAIMSYQYDTLASLAQTYTEFMKTRSFASRVAEKVTLDTGTILGALSTDYVANTQFYRITATYSDPEMTQTLANVAAQVLIDQNIARQQAQQEQIQAQSAPDPERDRLIEVRTSLESELDIYNSQITTMQARLAELEAQPKSEATDKQILDFQNQLVDFQSSRLSAINGLANTQAALATTSTTTAPNLDTAVVVDVAPLPLGPLPDTTIQSILIALLAALSVGAALAFLLEYMDYTIKTPEAMEAIYGSATQGAIGLAGGKRVPERSPAQLVTLNDPHSPMAESFRALRTGVSVAGLIAQMRSLMVTSARPGEGKTFVAANLAVSLAQNGSRVILVDADLRKPSLHYMFDLQLDPGFTNLVLDQAGVIEDFLRPTSVENLRVLTCGIIPPNPAELLGSPRAAAVMEQLAEYADIVVYDSPPAATVVDAIVIGPRVDAVLHVIQAGKTRIDLVRRCKALLERGGAHILGPVLNQVSLPELRAYSYYYSYNYKQAGRKSAKRNKAPSTAQVSSNGSAARTK